MGGGQGHREQDEAPRGSWNSSDPHRTPYSWTCHAWERRQHLNDNQRLFTFPSKYLWRCLIMCLVFCVSSIRFWRRGGSSSHLPLPHLSRSLSGSCSHAGVKTTQLGDKSQSHGWPCSWSHTLSPQHHKHMCVFVCVHTVIGHFKSLSLTHTHTLAPISTNPTFTPCYSFTVTSRHKLTVYSLTSASHRGLSGVDLQSETVSVEIFVLFFLFSKTSLYCSKRLPLPLSPGYTCSSVV